MDVTRVILIDDHPIFAQAIRALFRDESDSISVIAVTSTLHDAERLVREEKPDMAVIDFSMPDNNGPEVLKQLRKIQPALKVLCLTMHKEAFYVRKMVDAGVDGYILKTSDKSELVTAIHTIIQGQRYFSPDIAAFLFDELVGNKKSAALDPLMMLSKREIEVMHYIAQEMTNQEIADKLFISARTVESHRQNILDKIGARNTAGIVKFALEHRLHEFLDKR